MNKKSSDSIREYCVDLNSPFIIEFVSESYTYSLKQPTMILNSIECTPNDLILLKKIAAGYSPLSGKNRYHILSSLN